MISWSRKKTLKSTQAADFIAGHITSPLLRLHFLQAVMPSINSPLKLSRKSWLLVCFALAFLLLTAGSPGPRVRAIHKSPDPPGPVDAGPAIVRVEPIPEIWQVEKTAAFETYSNGLRIDNRFAVGTHARSYLVFSATQPDDVHGQRRSRPAGIVFHTTESLQVPFEAKENAALKDIGLSLLAYVRSKQAYNFLIDRFGRVYRVVRESDAANHSGHSIWADSEWVYLNLNQSFLAISFETRTLPGQEEAAVNPAQVRSAAMLTDVLRQRYGIPAGNCVTHAQVSVNAGNLRVGYHVDWASSFPFEQLNLPDNYALPLPAVFAAGFEFDTDFERRAGARVYQEAQLAEDILRDRAATAGMPVAAYRRMLQSGYRRRLSAVRSDRNRTDEEE